MRDFKEFIEKYKKVPYKDVKSVSLCVYYHNDFDLWFDKKKFDWEYSSYLCEHYSDHFDKWFDKEKFDWEYSSYALGRYCSEHFDKWFDENLFNWYRGRGSFALFEYCSEHLTNDLIWNLKDKIQWKGVDERHLNDSIKIKLKLAGYL